MTVVKIFAANIFLFLVSFIFMQMKSSLIPFNNLIDFYIQVLL